MKSFTDHVSSVAKALVLESDLPLDLQPLSKRFLDSPTKLPSSLLGTVLPLDLSARLDNLRHAYDEEVRKVVGLMHQREEELGE